MTWLRLQSATEAAIWLETCVARTDKRLRHIAKQALQKTESAKRAKAFPGSGKPVARLSSLVLKRPDLSACLLLAVIAALIFLPALVHTFPNGDDLAQHYWWASEFVKELRDGVVYPRWLSGAYAGQGSPVMFYYPPLPFYFTAAFHLLVRDPLKALALSCWLTLSLSGMSLYALSRSLLSRNASLIAAVFYITVHYHLFDFYQRSAINEFWAFVWVPLVLYAAYSVASGRTSYGPAYLAISYALLILTHLPSALVVTLVLPIFVLIQTREIKRLILGGAGVVVGVGMAAVYLSSVLFETGYLKSLHGFSRPGYQDSFLLEHLGSAFDVVPLPSNGNFSLFVLFGDWLALAFLVLLVAATVAILKSRKSSNLSQSRLLRSIWLVTAVSFLMTTRISLPLWLVIPRLKVIQFPIRWFVITSAGASFLVAASCAMLPALKRSLPAVIAFAVALTLSLTVSVLVLVKAPFQPEALQKRLVNYTDVLEYHPQWWDKQRHAEFDSAAVVTESGDARITAIDEIGTSQSYDVNASSEATLKFRTLYFPGWTARVDGELAKISPTKEGHIQLPLTPGQHRVTLDLKDTPRRRLGKVVSVASALIFLLLILAGRRSRRAVAENRTDRESLPNVGAGAAKRRQEKRAQVRARRTRH